MATANIQTKISINGVYNFVALKDQSFLLYTKKNIILFHKNRKSERIISFKNEDYYYIESYITSIKELKNKKGIILCCYGSDLFIYTIKSKKLKKLVVSQNKGKEILYDVIELQDRNILGITNGSILKIKIKENNYENDEISQIYKIPFEWLIDKIDQYFQQYLNIYELENNKFLIHSHSHSYSKGEQIFRRIKKENYENKIYIINLDNFNILYHKYFKGEKQSFIAIIKKYICYNYKNSKYLYNRNDYKLVFKLCKNIEYITKYNDNYILGINDKKSIILFNLSNIKKIQQIIKININNFNIMKYIKAIYKLGDRTVILLFDLTIFIIEF